MIEFPDDLLRREFVPRRNPLAIPSVGIFDSPNTAIVLNKTWASHVVGVLEALSQPDSWLGTDEEQFDALQEVEKLMASVALGVLPTMYRDRVLQKHPIAYWPCTELTGTVLADLSLHGAHGVPTNVTLNNLAYPGASMGISPSYNGTSSRTNLYSSALTALSNTYRNTGSLSLWMKRNAGTSTRCVFKLDSSDFGLDVTFAFGYLATNRKRTGGSDLISFEFSSTSWTHIAMTWQSGGSLITYVNGVQHASTGCNSAGNAALSSTACLIGAALSNPLLVWSGNAGHVALFDKVLSASEIAELSEAV